MPYEVVLIFEIFEKFVVIQIKAKELSFFFFVVLFVVMFFLTRTYVSGKEKPI